MALIKDSRGRKSGGGYGRLLGGELGYLLSRVQSAVIRSGNELENIIISLSANVIDDIDEFLTKTNTSNGVFVLPKRSVKKSILKTEKEPDLLILKIDNYKKHCYIVELKDGDNFDTKKAQGEIKLLTDFQKEISSRFQYTTSIHICCFNQPNKRLIVSGFKNSITSDMAMTGQELCDILGVNYQNIVDRRLNDQGENVNYFIDQFLQIESVKEEVQNKLNKESNLCT